MSREAYDGQTGVYVLTRDTSPPFGYPVALGLYGSDLSSQQQEIAIQIFRSLRFKPQAN